MSLTPAQLDQMDRDLARLLPHGSPPDGTIGPVKHSLEAVSLSMPTEQSVKSVWHWRRYPMGGWVYWSSPARMQRTDQGQDFEIPLGRHIIAPGWGKCVHHLSDREFPNGFGNPYAVVYIGSGRFGGRLWYLGHDNSEVIAAGTTFHTGRILAKPNHSLNTGWGWSEVGHAENGYPMGMSEGEKWHHLFSPAWKWSRS